MFQFPANPLVGQVFAPIAGIQFKWNGTGWAPFAQGFLVKSDTDLLYVPLTQRAAANGVATLDGTTKVPVAQLHAAEANGIASLDATGKVPAAQLPATSALVAMFVGCVVWRHSVGNGMLQANGQIVAKATYPELWAYAAAFTTADQVANPGMYKDIDINNFAVPNLAGLFVRAIGGNASALGVKQLDGNKSHAHVVNEGGGHFHGGGRDGQANGAGPGWGSTPSGALSNRVNTDAAVTGITLGLDGIVEARPVNVALTPCILTGRFP